MIELNISKLVLEEVKLQTRDAHKIRGYFANRFNSEIFSNRDEKSRFIYRYPLIQYKVINHKPIIIGINEGAKWLKKTFLEINYIKIDDKIYRINHKDIINEVVKIGYSDCFHNYRFATLWMALNQNNFKKYTSLSSDEKNNFLQNILVGNILSFFKNFDLRLDKQQKLICRNYVFREKTTNFKNKQMLAFEGSFEVNAHLPDYLGIGRSVSRGFGTILKL